MKNQKDDIIAVVVCGGSSTRMGSDKSLINYHGKPQRYYLYDLLKKYYDTVFISCNKNQSDSIEKGYEFIVDDEEYSGHGPISGLLSAFKKHPDKALLFIGCDYPFIKETDLLTLSESRDHTNLAAAYYNDQSRFFEPLLAIYEPKSYPELHMQFAAEKYSLNKFLDKSNAIKIFPENPSLLNNINTLEEYNFFIANSNKA